MLGRRVADTTHHDEFPSSYRTVARQPPPQPTADCLRRRRSYVVAEKAVPCGEKELCILCGDPPSVDKDEDKVVSVPCVDGILAA